MTATEISSARYPLGAHTRTHHVGISVADIDAATKWYRDVLGAEVTGTWIPDDRDAEIRFLSVNGFDFELVRAGGSRRGPTQGGGPPELAAVQGMFHMAFTVDDCDAAFEELKRRGVEFAWLPQDFPALKMRCAHFWDLEGNLLELVELTDDATR